MIIVIPFDSRSILLHGIMRIDWYTCSASASSMAALKQTTIRVVAIIAEGVPESDTKQLIAYARANSKVRGEMEIQIK